MVLVVFNDGEIDHCSEEIASGISLLEDTRAETTSRDRDVLESTVNAQMLTLYSGRAQTYVAAA